MRGEKRERDSGRQAGRAGGRTGGRARRRSPATDSDQPRRAPRRLEASASGDWRAMGAGEGRRLCVSAASRRERFESESRVGAVS